MTIDEAIEHAKRVAASCEGECADDHWQLVEWLRELVMLRKIVAVRDDATWQAVHEHEELKAKNAQLKAKADAQWSHIKKLQAELSHCIEKGSRDYDRDLDRMRRLATENAKLREQGARLFDKTLELGTENAKLRELLRTIWLAGDFRAFLGVGELEVRMHELGIER